MKRWLLAAACVAAVSGAQAETKGQIGVWHTRLKADKMDDRPVFTASTSDESSNAGLGVVCSPGDQALVVLLTPPFFMPDTSARAQYRFDGRAAVSFKFERPTSASITLRPKDSKEFIKLITESKKVLIRVHGYSDLLDASFSLDGGAEVLQLMKKTCG